MNFRLHHLTLRQKVRKAVENDPLTIQDREVMRKKWGATLKKRRKRRHL